MMAEHDGLRAKYDRLAPAFAESSYANLEFYMWRRFALAVSWGSRLRPGDRVVELGCGDGYLARLFLSHGFEYFGIDLSPAMVELARARAARARLEARIVCGDVTELALEPCDALVAYMRSFFTYVKNPLDLLSRFRPLLRKKVILDLDPRGQIALGDALGFLRAAGFRRIGWRPFLVPLKRRLPVGLLRVLALCEGVPLVRSAPLHWKFHCLLLGEP